MTPQEFRAQAHRFVDWMADFYENIESYPVRSQVQPREIFDQLPDAAPIEGEPMDAIFADFQQLILPGITHWQSPGFHAYFPGNSSFPSVLAEMLTATLGAQCMIWETSPAAAELEEKTLHWLRDMLGLPTHLEGVIQDTASTATLCAILSAREKATGYRINQSGFDQQLPLRVYCSNQTHSSIEKAVKIAGIGSENLVSLPVDAAFALQPAALRAAIEADLAAGMRPLCVVATLGTTSSTAVDPLSAIAVICREYDLWLHVDAAYVGTALVLPEFRDMIEGVGQADSFVMNPHKWMMVNFDCTAYFVKEKEYLIRTFEILPEYLKTGKEGQVNNYRDWGIALGRRFRALKLWFVLRSYGVAGIQAKVRNDLAITRWFADQVEAHPDFERMAPVRFNLVCFRYAPAGTADPDTLNQHLLQQLNDSGKLYLTHTRLNGAYVIRLVAGQTHVELRHVQAAWQQILAAVSG